MLIEPPWVVEGTREATSARAARGAAPAPLASAGLAGSGLADRFCFWRGRSGRRYVFSVYRLGGDADAVPRYADAVVIATRRDADGGRAVVDLGVTGGLPELSPVLSTALGHRGRADELHFHLLAGSTADRQAVVDDLAGVDRRG